MKLKAAVLALLVFSACNSGEDNTPAHQLERVAASADGVEFEVEYAFSQQGPLEPGATRSFQFVQEPPDYLRRFETSTFNPDGETLFVQTQWYVYDEGEFRTCFRLTEDADIECRAAPAPTGVFGFRPVDEMFNVARAATKELQNVESIGTRRILGVETDCFSADDAPDVEPPVGEGTPPPSVEDPVSFSYQFCYETNGILMGAESVTGSGDARRVYKIEAIKLNLQLEPDQVKFPGRVVDPSTVLGE